MLPVEKCLTPKPSSSPTEYVQRIEKYPYPSSFARKLANAGFHLQFLTLTTYTTSNFQYTCSFRSSGAYDKVKVSGSQRTVCTQQPMMGKLFSAYKIDSDASRNSHQISTFSKWIINMSDPIIQVLSVFQLPNHTMQLHTWCNFNNIRPQRAMEHNGESRQGNIDFQIAFHCKHQTASGLSEI